MKNIWKKTLADFLEEASSDAPTPGGGSVSAVTASMGFALVLMAVKVSEKKQHNELSNLLEEGNNILNKIKKHADEDIRVFNEYMQALKLPKNNKSEIEIRRECISKASIISTKEPLSLCRDIIEALDFTQRSIHLISNNIISDTKAGALILNSSLVASSLNVDINIPFIKDLQTSEMLDSEKKQYIKTSKIIIEKIINYQND
ncbi:MAG: cyclodeaminase/cyclohydrolase family protein [Thiolinea sp.]